MRSDPMKLRLGTALIVAGALGVSACTQADEMFGGGNAAQPSPRDEVKAASLRCDSIADERNWLDCYYGAAQPVRADLGLPPAPASQQSLVPRP
ncbi:MAG TPA: hypothetical protein VKB67_10085 [Rhizomicrobium sp.]|nr:hypothetical protein [Rhizomicrobium sp.]